MESLLINSAVNGESSSVTTTQSQVLNLPFSKIRTLMKIADPEVASINSEAVYAMCRATEMFIDHLAKLGYSEVISANRKTLMKTDLDNLAANVDQLFFLEDNIIDKSMADILKRPKEEMPS